MSAFNRRTVLRGAGAAAAAGLAAPALAQGGKPYAGTTINASCFQTTYFEYLKNYFPEFEEKTGIKVNFTMQAFPIYNQRTDLELSTKGSALDVCNVTFIYSGRWIGAGWMTSDARRLRALLTVNANAPGLDDEADPDDDELT